MTDFSQAFRFTGAGTYFYRRQRVLTGQYPKGKDDLSWLNSMDHSIHAPIAAPPWSPGSATITGNVRNENQDAVTVFRAGACQVALCADGLGGLPHGAEASRLALETAANLLRAQLEDGLLPTPEKLRDRAKSALCEAQRAIEKRAMQMDLKGNGGLRTTLIVLIGSESHWAYAYAGDGFGISISGLPGEPRIYPWLEPQKGNSPSEVACSLGPNLEGTPRRGLLERIPGEMMVLGSDGIGDRVDLESYGEELARLAWRGGGDLQGICESQLAELASYRNEAGDYIFDDNLSMAILGTASHWEVTC